VFLVVNAADVSISSPWSIAIFVVVGVPVAGFRAWQTERKEVSRLTRAADAAPPRPRLALKFDPSDPLCVYHTGSDVWIRVQVLNTGGARATNVRVALHDIEPAVVPTLAHHLFPKMHTEEEVFEVSTSPDGRATVYVDVLIQVQHATHGFTHFLAFKRRVQLRPELRNARLVLRLSKPM
jgi:hypothetical protein